MQAHEERVKSWFRAVATGRLDEMRVLHRQGAFLECTGSANRTALLLAAEAGHGSIVDWLVEQGANVLAVDSFGENLLHAAAASSCVRVLRSALATVEQGVDLNGEGKGKRTPLTRELAHRCHKERVRMFLDAGAEPARRHNFPMGKACQHGYLAILDLLHEAGGQLIPPAGMRVDERNHWASPLHEGALAGELGVVEWVLARGVPVDLEDADGNTALLAVCKAGRVMHDPVIVRLLQAGANPMHPNLENESAWTHAARRSDVPFIEHLRSHAQAAILSDNTPPATPGARPRL